jgi:hypothetical protein
MDITTYKSGDYKTVGTLKKKPDERKEKLIKEYEFNFDMVLSYMYKYEQTRHSYWKQKIKEYNQKCQILDKKIQEYIKQI